MDIASGGIQLGMDDMGRPNGEAHVKFTTKEQADKARGRDRQSIGHRCLAYS